MAQATIIGCITSKTINLLTSPLMIGREREKERQAAEAQTPVRNCRDRSQSLVDPDSELGRRIKFCK